MCPYVCWDSQQHSNKKEVALGGTRRWRLWQQTQTTEKTPPSNGRKYDCGSHLDGHINEIKLVATADRKQHCAVNKIAGLLELSVWPALGGHCIVGNVGSRSRLGWFWATIPNLISRFSHTARKQAHLCLFSQSEDSRKYFTSSVLRHMEILKWRLWNHLCPLKREEKTG